jgi:hypothetical protein
VDDLWKLGAPAGKGGPWLNTAVQAGAPSDPYLMTGYERKTVSLSHQGKDTVRFTLEVDFDREGWHPYGTFAVPPGQPVTHAFPDGYAAHWVRVKTDKAVAATAQFTYTPYAEAPISIARETRPALTAEALRPLAALSSAADGTGRRGAESAGDRAAHLSRAGVTKALQGTSALPAPPAQAGADAPTGARLSTGKILPPPDEIATPSDGLDEDSGAAGRDTACRLPAGDWIDMGPIDRTVQDRLARALHGRGWTIAAMEDSASAMRLVRMEDGPAECVEPEVLLRDILETERKAP